MGPTKDEVLRMLQAHARLPRPTPPVTLSPGYLRAVERWEEMPENAAGADKSWIDRSRRAFAAHFASARLQR